MAQHDYNIANQTGANFRTDLNNALSAIVSNNSGSSEPSTMYAYEWWIDTSNNVLKLRNSANNAWITMPFSITADNTVDINAGTVNGITSLSFSSGATVTSILDEDNLGSDSATALATQQSIKAYVDSQVTAQDLDISDGSSTIAIDLDSETLSLLGGTGVTSSASGNGVTFSIGQSVGTSDNVVFNQVTGALVGNASTATALATARTISGVSFDGTANITLDTDDIGEGTTNKYFTAERVDDQVNTLLTAGANISLTYDDAAGTLTIANTNSADITSVVAGNGLTGGGTSGDVTLAVGVDDSSIEISSDALRVKATGITNAMLAGSIANAKLANSSITVNSQAIALGGSHTFDTDDIGEGSSNLYYTDARANSAIDARVTNTFINNLSGVVADTATALATGRTIALSGDVTASGVSFDGTGNITLSTTIAADSVALGTDTTGNYVATIAGTTNEIEVSGSGSETATVTIGLPDDVTIAGNLTVNGTTTTVNSDTLSVTDPLIKLAKANSGADSLDIGFYGLYDTSGSQDLYAGLFRDANDSGKFKLFKDLQVEPTTTVNTSGTGYAVGTLVSNLEGNVTGNVTGTVTSISNHSTSDLSEGTNLYYTDARFDTRLGTKTTDNLTEGSSNLYMTTERVQDIVGGMVTGNTETGITVTYDDSDGTLDFVVGTLNQDTTGNAATATALETARLIGGVSFDGTGNIDLAGVNTTGNQDTSGNAATATALATGRTIGMTGDVVWTSASFDGSGNVTGTATIQPNSVALSTDTTGDYVSTITAGTGLTSTGATSGEGIAHTLSVDAAQTQITSVGTLTSLTVSGTADLGSTITNGDITIDVDDTPSLHFKKQSSADILSSINVSTDAGTGGKFVIQTKRNGDTALDRLTIDDDGKVGIGCSPAFTLDVQDTSDPAQIRLKEDGNTNGFILKNFNGNEAQLVNADNGAMVFKTNDTERVRIDSTGKVGIGNATPLGKLTISNAAGANAPTSITAANTYLQLGSDDYGTSSNGKFMIGFGYTDATNTNSPAYMGFEETSSSGDTKGDLTFHTRDVITDTAPTERMRIDSSGAVVVNNSGGDAQIYLGGTSGTSRMYLARSGADSLLWNVSNGNLRFGTNNTERVRIDSSGNLMVGTTSTTPADGVSPAVLIGDSSDSTSGLVLSNSSHNWLLYNDSDGDFNIYDSDNDADRLSIDSSGNVIIKTYLISSDGTRSNYFGTDGNGGLIGMSTNHYLRFITNNTERMRIASGGSILFGTTASPDGTSNGGSAFISDSAGRMNLYIATTTTGAADIANFFNGNGLVGRILTSGSATTYQTSSDYRLKENVNYDFNGLERLKKLKPARFNFIADADTTVDGFLAHEVQEVVPEAVGGEKDGEEMQSMDYGRITPLLVKAIQEQQTQIEALQSEIKILKGE